MVQTFPAPSVGMFAPQRLCYDPYRRTAALSLNCTGLCFGNRAPLETIHKRRSTLIDRELKRVLGPFDVTCVVVGSIIGVGIFFVPSEVAHAAGSGRLTMIAWACGGAIALMGALTFAELGGLYPNTGGQYEVLRDAYGPLPAFLFVFCNATAVQTGGMAIIATICAKYLALAVSGAVPGTVGLIFLASALIVGLVAANAIGVRWGAG
ncbi:MAG: amino acid permease, partial [Planctomycetes bacterium]|nr:amino acid permease [Planctomycetota bacterium]